MKLPANDYIVIRPSAKEEETEGPVSASSMSLLREGEVLDMGPDKCLFTHPEGFANPILKSELFPGLSKGSHVMFRLHAEERVQRIDQAYRLPIEKSATVKHPNGETEQIIRKDFVLYIKVTDIVAYSPPEA